MATTAKGYPYPLPGVNNDTSADLQALAEAVDASPGVAPLSTAARDALSGGQRWVGRQIYNTTTKQFEWWDGTDWQPVGFMRGEIKWLSYKPATAPKGWLIADGSQVSQSTYSDLFGLLGTLHNTGGETAGNFRLPRLTRRVPVGWDSTDLVNYDVGDVGGLETNTLTVPQLPAHTHAADHDHASFNSGAASTTHTHTLSGTTGANDAGISIGAAGSHAHDTGSGRSFVVTEFGGGGVGAGPGTTNQATTGAVGHHSHAVSDPTHNHSFSGTTSAGGAHDHPVDVPAFVGPTGSAGSGAAVENRMPFITLYAMVKY